MRYILRFASHLNFLDPTLTREGKPYGPQRYKEIVKECYLISKYINTPYTEVLKISPIERNYIFEFLTVEADAQKEAYEKARAEREANRKK